MHVHRHAGCGVERDRGPDRIGILFRNAVAAQEVASRVGAVNLEALIRKRFAVIAA
jgi:hypothetical protein